MQAYLTTQQLSGILRVSVKSILRGIHRGEIPYLTVGPYYRVPVSFLGLPMPRAEGSSRNAMHYQQLTLFDTTKHRVWRYNTP